MALLKELNDWKKIEKITYNLYVGVGILSFAILAGSVIFSVLMRYLFAISFISVEEFITTAFVFIIYWGLGICVMENAHVSITFFYDMFPKKVKRFVNVLNHVISLLVSVVVLYYTVPWVMKAGKVLSVGMQIKMMYIYGVMIVGFVPGIICMFVRLIQLICVPEALTEKCG